MTSPTQWTKFEQTLGDGDGQVSLVCCSSWGHKESEMTQQLNKNNIAYETKPCWKPVEEVSITGGLARIFLKGGKEEIKFECWQVSLLRSKDLEMSAVFTGIR